MIDRKHFFDTIKSNGLFAKLEQSQVDGMNAILSEFEVLQWKDGRHLAYVLATCRHETANTMQPIEEIGKGKKQPYGKKIKMNRKPYSLPDQLYFGRGFVQLTWFENYEKAGKKLGVDLLNYPELALQLDIATKILFQGMSLGWFTGRKLIDYINKFHCDYTEARRIINGKDKALLIAGYAKKFQGAIKFMVAL